MVYKTKFLKQVIEEDYTHATDETKTWELTNEALAALWITVKGDLVVKNTCIDDIMESLTKLDLWFGGFNVLHYEHPIKALVMNCKLKGHWPYHVFQSQTVDDVVGITFPILFGAPYLNDMMALPRSETNRKRLTLGLDVATDHVDALYIDIAEVLLPDAKPVGCIKQEEISVPDKGTGDKDLWLQTNWDILKLLLYNPTTVGAADTQTIQHAGLEVDDFAFGYKSVPFSILHGELMDELEGSGPVEDHIHGYGTSDHTDMAEALETWIQHYGQMDFFYNYDLKWRVPAAGASTVKLKYNVETHEDWAIVQANYVPTTKL